MGRRLTSDLQPSPSSSAGLRPDKRLRLGKLTSDLASHACRYGAGAGGGVALTEWRTPCPSIQ